MSDKAVYIKCRDAEGKTRYAKQLLSAAVFSEMIHLAELDPTGKPIYIQKRTEAGVTYYIVTKTVGGSRIQVEVHIDELQETVTCECSSKKRAHSYYKPSCAFSGAVMRILGLLRTHDDEVKQYRDQPPPKSSENEPKPALQRTFTDEEQARINKTAKGGRPRTLPPELPSTAGSTPKPQPFPPPSPPSLQTPTRTVLVRRPNGDVHEVPLTDEEISRIYGIGTTASGNSLPELPASNVENLEDFAAVMPVESIVQAFYDHVRSIPVPMPNLVSWATEGKIRHGHPLFDKYAKRFHNTHDTWSKILEAPPYRARAVYETGSWRAPDSVKKTPIGMWRLEAVSVPVPGPKA